MRLGAAPGAEFIVVKLKKANPFFLERYLVPEEQENVYQATDLMLGIEYLIEQGIKLNKPVSICIGIGDNYGGHDGFTYLEEYISDVAQRIGICVSIAAGNESQAKHHFMRKTNTISKGTKCRY
ncbi:MAG: hypothetical protein PHR25_04835 [Clostridia bacterium]|nr:hypothetical protein [Clostridia bacterium]MDD4376090.1 hypothetical protein [Clostridia bacterium]